MANNPWWFDPSLPAAEDCVLKPILHARAERIPDQVAAVFEDGTSWTYRECLDAVRKRAAQLQHLGVTKTDRVLAWLPNDQEMVLCWFAICYLGAVFVPLNTAYRGGVLEHVINITEAELLFVHPELVERLAHVKLTHLRKVVVCGDLPTPDLPYEFRSHTELTGDPDTLGDSAEVMPWDIQCILFTSGTTGPSKAVLQPYLQLYTTSVVNYGRMGEGESILVNLPLFHVGGTTPIYCSLIRGGCFHLVSHFSTDQFWNQVNASNSVTTAGLIGAMAPFLCSAEPTPDDADNSLKFMVMFPINEQTVAMGKRFGFDYFTGFNMTEVSSPLISEDNRPVYGACGKPRTGVSCRLVDANDMEVERGEPGELIVRTDLPWTLNAGYLNMPEETARAWRNGWFHTGDIFRQDEEGYFYFVDRIKDTIRRRGENISSLEVEAEVLAFPAVAEVVAVAVPSEYAEDEVLVAVVPRNAHQVDPEALCRFLIDRLAYFMVPRYVRVVDEIPKTETNKPRKTVFRDAGITPDTWDREAAGIRLKRERLS